MQRLPAATKAVQGSRFNQRIQSPFSQMLPVNTGYEFKEGMKWTSFSPGLDNGVRSSPTHMADGSKSQPNAFCFNGKFHPTAIDFRRQ
jgi:hypothetical protein